MRRVGLIGTGRHGSRYASHIVSDIDGLELTAIARRSPEGKDQAALWKAKWHREWQALVADPEVEAVIAVVPPSLNVVIARACAAVRKPLLIEKPLAVNGKQATEIVAVMKAVACPLTVGQTLRYNPVIQGLKARIKEMGALYSFTANQRLEPSALAWHDDRKIAGAGVVIHTAIHVFDTLHFITGKRIKRVQALGRLCRSHNLEDLVMTLVEMENGTVGTIDISKVSLARSGRYEFICEKGHLYGEQILSFVEMVRGNDLKRVEEPLPVNTVLSLLHDWRDFLAGRKQNPVPGEDGLYAVKVCDACQRSVGERRWIAVD